MNHPHPWLTKRKRNEDEEDGQNANNLEGD